ncbi:hypothetical protein [Robiginitalea sp. SC105]|uniref:hypothetical protein n=1 Tax=Robiginitalea sp. SC105 TaxID=2762332 RepID=UPI0016398397|nr:hypothetical protein [Robiginitalea sp. SC105]MBC2838628.1 hypothetical protein [Robiginitalea sp. SC105]
MRHSIIICIVFTVSLLFCNCSNVDVILPEDGLNRAGSEIDSTSLTFDLDEGEFGFFLDVREIFRKGYSPKEAIISFPGYPQFDTVQPIDPWTTLASFSVEVDSLNEMEKEAFENGIDTEVLIQEDGEELVFFQQNLIFDQTFRTIWLNTGKEPIGDPQLDVRENQPYLITVDGEEGLLRRGENFALDDPDYNWYGSHYVQNQPLEAQVEDNRKFYFVRITENQYKIRYGEAILDPNLDENFDAGWWGLHNSDTNDDGAYYITSETLDNSSTFELVKDTAGWFQLRFVDPPDPNTQESAWIPYLGFDSNKTSLILAREGDEDYRDFRFKLLTEVNWEFEDLGIEYLPPIFGPVSLDFAFRSVLTNCSSATLTEEVGRVVTKTRTTSFTLTEGISLFSSSTSSVESSIEVGAETSLGSDLYGGEVTGSVTAGVTLGFEVTTSLTLDREREITEEESVSEEVSRKRTIELPPFTVVEIYDAVRTIKDIYIPYVLKYRLTGTNAEDGRVLTGDEIAHNLENNNFSGLINTVNDTEVLFTLKGRAQMNSIFESSSGAKEILNGCTD